MKRTQSMSHTKDSATKTRTFRTFSPAARRGLELMAELNRAEISDRIKQARDQAGLTQPELGELLEPPIHFRTIQTWEAPDGPVPFGRLDEIAKVTGVTKEWLLHGDEEVDHNERSQLLGEIRSLRELVERLVNHLEAG